MIELKIMNREQLLKKLEEYNLPKNEYIIISGAALVLHGISNKTRDIDIVVTPKLEKYLLDKYDVELECHNIENGKNIYFIDNIINFSNNHSEIFENMEYQIVDEYNVQKIDSIIKLKEKMKREKDIKDIEKINKYQLANNINVLVLAYLGDAVYELYIRNYLVNKGILKVNNLQKKAIKYVSANNQAQYLKLMIDDNFLNESEIEIIKRARNHKSHKCPKNTNAITYRNSTGIEALIGYLHIKNDYDRINEIMKFIVGE